MRQQPGRENAHVPTPEELDNNLFANRDTGALKDTFNTGGSFPDIVYRSSWSLDEDTALVQRFDEGHQILNGRRDYPLPVRFVW